MGLPFINTPLSTCPEFTVVVFTAQIIRRGRPPRLSASIMHSCQGDQSTRYQTGRRYSKASALIYARAFTGGEKPSVDSCRYASHANTSFSRALCSHRSHLHLSSDDFITATGSDFFTHSRIYCCLFSCPVKWSLYNATTRRRSQRHASQRSAEASITPLFLLYGQKELQQPLG